MRNSFLLIFLTLVVSISLVGQNNEDEARRYRELNSEASSYFQKGDFKKAQKRIEESLAISLRIYGREHYETGVNYRNLGQILRVRKKYRAAAASFEKALEVLDKNSNEKVTVVISALDGLGNTLALSKQPERAEKAFLRLIELVERHYGKESKEVIPHLKTTAYFYVLIKQHSRAEELFIRMYSLAIKTYGAGSEELDDLYSEQYCFVNSGGRAKVFENFWKKVRELSEGRVVNESVLIGKAKSLPRPDYPPQARQVRASGAVRIAVTIGKDGRVKRAKAVCGGNPYLIVASREAALKARFKPTTVNGEPVEVRGVIVYTFRP